VKESPEEEPWLVAEPSTGKITMWEPEALIGFILYPGTTLEQAYRIAESMNEDLATMHMTVFDTPPLYHAGRG
jgi:hypothetical protein